MADKIDMSLDDIIKKNKSRGGGRGRGASRGGNFRRGGRGGGGRRGSFGGSGRPFRGGFRGGRGGARGGAARSPYQRGNANGHWSHDMYDGPKRGGIVRESGSAKLVVANLDFGVSDSDIQELFTEFGRLKAATVHYDRSGRSLGTADVIFERRTDAIKAMKQYNGVPLDGRPMKIQFATSEIAAPRQPVAQRTGGNFGVRRGGGGGRIDKGYRAPRRGGPFRGGRGGQSRGGRGGPRGSGRGGARRGRGAKAVAPSREDLDKELDSYLKAR